MTDGTLAVRRRDPKANEEAAAEAKATALAGGAYEYFADMEAVFGTGYVKPKGKDLPKVVGPADEFKVESKRRAKLKEFDRFLKAFKYSAALDAGLKKVRRACRIVGVVYGVGRPLRFILWCSLFFSLRRRSEDVTVPDIQTVRPATSFALIQELIYRDALRIALSGRDETTLDPILAFLVRHIIDPRFSDIAANVVGIIIGQCLYLYWLTMQTSTPPSLASRPASTNCSARCKCASSANWLSNES